MANGLVERGIECEVLTASEPGAPDHGIEHGIEVTRCASPITIASTPLPPGLPRALAASRADIVHLHYPWPPGEVAYWRGGRGRPLVVTVHCEVVRQQRIARWLAPLTRTVLSQASAILVTSDHMRHVAILEPFADRIETVLLGVDLDRFRPTVSNDADPLGDLTHPRIAFVGRLRHYKGLALLGPVLKRLVARGFTDAQLVVIGDGPERGRLEASLELAGVRDRATLLGEVSDSELVATLAACDAAVLPSTSRAEAFGIAIAEAQACGLPAVVTDVGTGTVLTVRDGVSGKVVEAGNVEAIADGLAWCVEPAHRATLREAARAHAERTLSAKAMVDNVIAVYQRISGTDQRHV